MRLIDADDLKDWIRYCVVRMSADAICKRLDAAPTVDAVPVVRCPDCSWRTNSSFCRRHGHYVRDDFFCAYGTTGDVRGCRPAKKIEKKAEERCLATGGPCSRCTPGPCDHRKTVIADDSGQ